MKRFTPLLMILVLFAAACASSEPQGGDDTNLKVAQNDDASEKAKDPKNNRAKKDKPGSKERERDGEAPRGASADGKATGGGNTGEDRDGGTSTARESGTREGQPYPDAGTYTFAQSGFEEFCDSAGRCDKQKLPARQPTKLAYEQASKDSAVVVTEQSSGSRMARTWTRFVPSGAHITKFYVRMEYSGFRFERTYVPRPPVEALRFPLTSGDAWSGRWEASTSGSYSVKVGERRSIEVGGRSVTVFPIDTITDFKGDFEGRSRITAFVDPRTKAVVATDGALNVASQFGRYSTVFETRLLGGPGY